MAIPFGVEITQNDYSKIVTAAGTAEPLFAASTVEGERVCYDVLVQADVNNTGDCVVGTTPDIAISAVVGSTVGYRLFPGQAIIFEQERLSEIYVDALNSGDAVEGIYTY